MITAATADIEHTGACQRRQPVDPVKPCRVDVMKVTTGEKEFWSLGSISAGFDALCAQRANGLKWPKGPNSYIAALLLELPKFRPIDYHLVVDGEHRDVTAMLCGVANVKNFGGGMIFRFVHLNFSWNTAMPSISLARQKDLLLSVK